MPEATASPAGLRLRLVAPVVLAAIPVAWVVFDMARSWRLHEVADSLSTAVHLTRHAAEYHQRTLRAARRTVSKIATTADSIDEEKLERLMGSLASKGGTYLNVAVLAPDRTVVSAYQEVVDEVARRAGALATAAAMRTEPLAGSYERDPATGQITAVVAKPALTPDGRVDRIVFALIELSWIRNAVTETRLPSGTVVDVYDPSHRLLLREPSSGPERSMPDAVLRRVFTAAVEGSIDVGSPDPDRVYAYAPLKGLAPTENLYMVIDIPRSAATHVADVALRRTTVALALAGLFVFVVAWVSSGSLSRDIDALVATTSRLAAGDTSQAPAPTVTTTSELTRLAGGIDTLAATLVDREQQLLRRYDELTTREQRMRAVIESGDERVALIDADGRMLYATPAPIQQDGYRIDELFGRSSFEFVHPDDREALASVLAQARQTPGTMTRAAFRVKGRSGGWRWLEGEICNLLDEPAVGAIVGRYRDVTASREAEDQRRLQQEALESAVLKRTVELFEANASVEVLSRAVEQTADSVFITDRDGVIEYVNPAFEAMTGFTRAEAIGKTPRILASGAHDRRFYETLWSTIMSGRPFKGVLTNRTKHGRRYNEDQSITPIRDATGAITHFVTTGRDITERKRTEAALRRLNDALEKEAARIASVLHDEAGQFLSTAHITLADLARELSPALRARVHEVRSHLDRAELQLRLVSHELHPRVLEDLGLPEAVRFLASSIGRRGGFSVDLDLAGDAQCPRGVDAVFYRFVQEALTNVAKHARATHAWVSLACDRAWATCSVRDDGAGFAVEETDSDCPAFSLGLALMRDRIEAIGGSLRITSTPQNGTELRATVPLEP